MLNKGHMKHFLIIYHLNLLTIPQKCVQRLKSLKNKRNLQGKNPWKESWKKGSVNLKETAEKRQKLAPLKRKYVSSCFHLYSRQRLYLKDLETGNSEEYVSNFPPKTRRQRQPNKKENSLYEGIWLTSIQNQGDSCLLQRSKRKKYIVKGHVHKKLTKK